MLVCVLERGARLWATTNKSEKEKEAVIHKRGCTTLGVPGLLTFTTFIMCLHLIFVTTEETMCTFPSYLSLIHAQVTARLDFGAQKHLAKARIEHAAYIGEVANDSSSSLSVSSGTKRSANTNTAAAAASTAPTAADETAIDDTSPPAPPPTAAPSVSRLGPARAPLEPRGALPQQKASRPLANATALHTNCPIAVPQTSANGACQEDAENEFTSSAASSSSVMGRGAAGKKRLSVMGAPQRTTKAAGPATNEKTTNIASSSAGATTGASHEMLTAGFPRGGGEAPGGAAKKLSSGPTVRAASREVTHAPPPVPQPPLPPSESSSTTMTITGTAGVGPTTNMSATARNGAGRRASLALPPRRVATNKPTAAGAVTAEAPDQTTESVTRTLFEDYDDDDHEENGCGDTYENKDENESTSEAVALGTTMEPTVLPVAAAVAAAKTTATPRPAHLSDFFEVAQSLSEAAGGFGRGHRSGVEATMGRGDTFSGVNGSSSGASTHWQDRLRAAKALPDVLALYNNSRGGNHHATNNPSSLSSTEQEWCRCAVDALLGDLHQKVCLKTLRTKKSPGLTHFTKNNVDCLTRCINDALFTCCSCWYVALACRTRTCLNSTTSNLT